MEPTTTQEHGCDCHPHTEHAFTHTQLYTLCFCKEPSSSWLPSADKDTSQLQIWYCFLVELRLPPKIQIGPRNVQATALALSNQHCCNISMNVEEKPNRCTIAPESSLMGWAAELRRTPCLWRCVGCMCWSLNWWGKWWKAGPPSLMVWRQRAAFRAMMERDCTMVRKTQRSESASCCFSLSLPHVHTPLIPESCCFPHHPNCQVGRCYH